MISLLAIVASLTSAVVSVDSSAARVPSLAVMPLQGRSLQPEEAEVLCEALTSKLKSLGHAHVIERSQIDKILAEQGFQKSGACEKSECAVEVGRLAGIDQMVVGSVGKLGETWSMVVRLVSVQTGEILASAQDTREGQVDVLLRESVPALASQLLGLGPKVATPAAAPVQPSANKHNSAYFELNSIVANKGYLEKKGLVRARLLSDSVDFVVRHSLYRDASVSGWWAVANIYVVPVGSMVQGDWTGIGMMAAGYLVGGIIASRTSGDAGAGIVGATYLFGLIRPIVYANNTNSSLKNGLQLAGYLGPNGRGAGAMLAYRF
jgi:TolB-like protein